MALSRYYIQHKLSQKLDSDIDKIPVLSNDNFSEFISSRNSGNFYFSIYSLPLYNIYYADPAIPSILTGHTHRSQLQVTPQSPEGFADLQWTTGFLWGTGVGAGWTRGLIQGLYSSRFKPPAVKRSILLNQMGTWGRVWGAQMAGTAFTFSVIKALTTQAAPALYSGISNADFPLSKETASIVSDGLRPALASTIIGAAFGYFDYHWLNRRIHYLIHRTSFLELDQIADNMVYAVKSEPPDTFGETWSGQGTWDTLTGFFKGV